MPRKEGSCQGVNYPSDKWGVINALLTLNPRMTCGPHELSEIYQNPLQLEAMCFKSPVMHRGNQIR